MTVGVREQRGPLGQAVELSEKDSGKIARVVGFLLSNTHFKRTPLNDDISQAFLRKYMESLDYRRMVFLQSDYEEFEAKYGTLLDNLTKRGDVSPANEIHKRYFTRLKTRLLYTYPSPRDRTRSRMPSSACKKS